MKDIYKMVKIDGFEDYLISKDGKILSNQSKTPKYLSFSKNRKGYLKTSLYKDKKQYTILLHRLIAKAFIDNPKPDEYNIVDHINGDNQDNRIENLRWCNISINCRNQKLTIKNTSGHQGVRFRKSMNSYVVKWSDEDKKLKTKSFSINKYPNAKELAIEYRQKMVDKYYQRQ